MGKSDVFENKDVKCNGVENGKNNLEKQKKKVKKRKKKNNSSVGAPKNVEKGNKQEMNQRFSTVLSQLQQNSVDGEWVGLENCNIHEAKSRKIIDALINNTTVYAIDLSRNFINNTAAIALAHALRDGAASELVWLDLRGNPISGEAVNALNSVQIKRKQLKIHLGNCKLDVEEPASEDCMDTDIIEPLPTPNIRPMAMNRFLMQHVQGLADSPRDGTDHLSESDDDDDLDYCPGEIWKEMEEYLHSPDFDLTVLISKLHILLMGMHQEMSNCALPMLGNTHLSELQPYLKTAVLNLELLHSVLDVKPASCVATCSGNKEFRSLGSHSIKVVEMVDILSNGACGVINSHLYKSKLIPRLLYLCFQSPNNNVFQSTCLCLLGRILALRLRFLWLPLFEPGMGMDAHHFVDGNCRSDTLLDYASAVFDTINLEDGIGTRGCEVGFAYGVISKIQSESELSNELAEFLSNNNTWSHIQGPQDVYQRLQQEQSKKLGSGVAELLSSMEISDSALVY